MNVITSVFSLLLFSSTHAEALDSVVIQTNSNAIPKVAQFSPNLEVPTSSDFQTPHWSSPTAVTRTSLSLPTSSRLATSSLASANAANEGPTSGRAMKRGDVFGLVTMSENDDVNGETVVIYNDGTLGIKEPSGPGYLFQTLLLPEYNLMVVPEPLNTVKINDKGVFYLNSSLFNPSPIFDSRGTELRVAGGTPVVCPSWNSVLVLARHNENVPCQDAIKVDLGIIPITAD